MAEVCPQLRKWKQKWINLGFKYTKMNIRKWEDIVRLNFALELYAVYPIMKTHLNPAGSHWTHTQVKRQLWDQMKMG